MRAHLVWILALASASWLGSSLLEEARIHAARAAMSPGSPCAFWDAALALQTPYRTLKVAYLPRRDEFLGECLSGGGCVVVVHHDRVARADAEAELPAAIARARESDLSWVRALAHLQWRHELSAREVLELRWSLIAVELLAQGAADAWDWRHGSIAPEEIGWGWNSPSSAAYHHLLELSLEAKYAEHILTYEDDPRRRYFPLVLFGLLALTLGLAAPCREPVALAALRGALIPIGAIAALWFLQQAPAVQGWATWIDESIDAPAAFLVRSWDLPTAGALYGRLGWLLGATLACAVICAALSKAWRAPTRAGALARVLEAALLALYPSGLVLALLFGVDEALHLPRPEAAKLLAIPYPVAVALSVYGVSAVVCFLLRTFLPQRDLLEDEDPTPA